MKAQQTETWKPVPSFPKYSVSNTARVWNHEERRELTQSRTGNGYRCVRIYNDAGGKTISVHRLVALAHLPNPEGKSDVNHINGVKHDNRLENLEWATHKENGQHALKVLGRWSRQPSGENHKQSKLTLENVRQIRKMHAEGMLYSQIARHFGVAAGTITNVIMGKTWKNAA